MLKWLAYQKLHIFNILLSCILSCEDKDILFLREYFVTNQN